MSVSRRKFLAAAASLPLGFYLTSGIAQGTGPKIGDEQAAFDTWFGQGTEQGEFISYPPLAAGRASYFVAYADDGRAVTIVGDFNHLPGGGIPFDVSEIGQSQYVPADAVPGTTFNMGGLGGGYAVKSWQSPSLASALGTSGQIVVVDRFYQSYAEGLFLETIIQTETAETHPIVPTGEQLGPHSTEEEWLAYPGGVGMAQTGFVINVPPVPGSTYITYNVGVNIEPDPPLLAADAAELISSMLPVSDLVWTTLIDVTPVSDGRMRLHQFQARDTGRFFLSAQFLEGDEATGSVSEIKLWNAWEL